MRGTTGLTLIAIGVLYVLFAVAQAVYGRVLLAMSPAVFPAELQGLVHSIFIGEPFTASFLLGTILIVFGHVFAWIERGLSHPIPSFIGWEVLALSAIGVARGPSLGLGLVVIVAIYTVVAARRRTRAPADTSPADSTKPLRGTIGLLLIGIGILHVVFAIAQVTFWSIDDSSAEISSGLILLVARQLSLWLLIGGSLMALGNTLVWLERRLHHRMPSFVGWELLVVSLVALNQIPAVMSVGLSPLSGAWLVLPVAILAIRLAWRHRLHRAAVG